MSGRRDESLLLDDIVDAALRLVELGGSVPPGMLGADRALADQVLWNLMVLGESTKRLPPAVRDRFADVPWSAMATTRDRIVHHYGGMNWFRVERILMDDLPPLLPRLVEIRDLLRTEFDSADARPSEGRP